MNVNDSMISTFDGITISFSLEHPQNEAIPICLTDEGIFISNNDEHSSKQLFLIASIGE